MSLRPISTAPTIQRRKLSPRRQNPSAPVVLYVEDSADNWEVTQLHLRRHFRLLWARDDEEACALLRAHHDELRAVLMDVELRGSTLNGVDLTRLIRGTLAESRTPSFARGVPTVTAPVFFVTAYGSSYPSQGLLAAGGDRVLSKPVNFGELSFALAQLKIESMPSVAARVAVAAAQQGFAREDLFRLISQDERFVQRMCAVMALPHILSANAATVKEQLFSLDTATIRDIAASIAVIDLIPSYDDTSDEESNLVASVLLTNSLRRACVASRIGQYLNLNKTQCFVLGMLLESGITAHAQHDAPGALQVARTPAIWRGVFERAFGERPHAWRSAEIARDWHLPDEIVNAIEQHHNAAVPQGPYERTAWIAEIISGVFETGDPQITVQLAIAAAHELGIARANVNALLEALPRDVECAAAAFGAIVDVQRTLAGIETERSSSLSLLFESYQDLGHLLADLLTEKDALTDRFRLTANDMTEQETIDALTGLANRRAFDEALQSALAHAVHADFAISVVFLDLDRFSAVNDQWGHRAGDDVLKKVAAVIGETTRNNDFAARYGGQRFAIILRASDAVNATEVAERIRVALQNFRFESPSGTPIATTASFGVSTLMPPVSIDDGPALLGCANAALTVAKEGGRNRVVVDRPSPASRSNIFTAAPSNTPLDRQ